jgi:hypothetical protein
MDMDNLREFREGVYADIDEMKQIVEKIQKDVTTRSFPQQV